MHQSWHRDSFTLSTDPVRLDLDMIHGYLSTCYWARGIPRDAHGLYAKFGFTPLAAPDRWMEQWVPDSYATDVG